MDILILTLKNTAWMLVAWMWSFVLPIGPFLITAILMVLLDMYTGISAARARNEAIHSKGMRRSIRKILGYFSAILAVHWCDYVFGVKAEWGFDMAFTIAGLIALTELKSILENVSSYTGINFWQSLIDALPDIKLKEIFSPKKKDDK